LNVCQQDCRTPTQGGAGRALFYLTDHGQCVPVNRYQEPPAGKQLYCTPSCGARAGDLPVTSRNQCPVLSSVEQTPPVGLPQNAQCYSLTSDAPTPDFNTRAVCSQSCPTSPMGKQRLNITPESTFLDPSNCSFYTWTQKGIDTFTKADWFCFGMNNSGKSPVCNTGVECATDNRCHDTICVADYSVNCSSSLKDPQNPCSPNGCKVGSVLTQGQSELISFYVFTWGVLGTQYNRWSDLVLGGFLNKSS
jgi:hypothetical protein